MPSPQTATPTGRDGFAVPSGAERVLTQEAPCPEALETLVGQLRYKAGWRFWLQGLDRGQGSKGLTLVIQRVGPDSYHPERELPVNHYMIVPAAAYDMRSWRRWLLEQVLLVEQHEACEFFQIVQMDGYLGQDGEQHRVVDRPYAPSHGFGQDPYLIRELGTEEDRRTSFRNELNP